MDFLFQGSWQYTFMPSPTLLGTGLFNTCVTFSALTLLMAMSNLLLLAATGWFGYRNIRYVRGWNSVILILAVLGANVISYQTRSDSFAPLFILPGILLFTMGIASILVNQWAVLRNIIDNPPQPVPYIKAHFWLYTLMSSHFLIPLLIFQMPVTDVDGTIFYWGAPVIMVGLYLLYFILYLPGLYSLLKLNIPIQTLSADLRDKYNQVKAALAGERQIEFLICASGFYNAVAMPSKNRIIMGIDVLKELTVEEARAIALHEKGHIYDKRHMLALARIRMTADIFVLMFAILIQFNAPFFRMLGLLFLLSALILITRSARNHSLKGEFIADKYVKDMGDDIYEDLLSGITRLSRQSGLDDKFCRRTNYPHLDLEERKEMVTNGRFRLKRRSSLRTAALIIVSIIIGVGYGIVQDRYFSSPDEKWSSMHDRYHRYRNAGEFAGAKTAIQEALRLSMENHGTLHKDTHTSFVDLTEVSIMTGQYDVAKMTGIKAVRLAGELYRTDPLESVRSLANMGKIHYYLEEYRRSETWFGKALDIQRSEGDSEANIARTLDWLTTTLMANGQWDKTIPLYREMLTIYVDDPDHADSFIDTLLELTHALSAAGNEEESQRTLQQAFSKAQSEYAADSAEYAGVLLRIGAHHLANERLDQAEDHYLQAIGILRRVPDSAYNRTDTALYHLAGLYHTTDNREKLIATYLEIIQYNEEVFGEWDSANIYPLRTLGQIYEEAGEQERARECFQKVLLIEESNGTARIYEKLEDSLIHEKGNAS